MNKFVVGDLHGSYVKLLRALDNANFSDSDILYCTGDICDRGPEIYKTLDFVISLGDRFKSVFGNHDVWAYDWLNNTLTRDAYDCWDYNGGNVTFRVLSKYEDRFDEFKNFYGKMPYMIEEDDFRIMHTPTYKWVWDRCNIDIHNVTLSNSDKTGLIDDRVYDGDLFDRSIIHQSSYYGNTVSIDDFGESVDLGKDTKLTIVGHTPLQEGILYDEELNIINVDTAGFCYKERYRFDGCISVMNLKTFEFFDSDGLTGKVK